MAAGRSRYPRFGRVFPALLQGVVAVAALGILLLAPPRDGQMTLLPLNPAAAHELPTLALSADTRLIGRGPYDGALVVTGHRPDFLSYLFDHSVLVLGVPDAGCLGGAPA